jgi:hypothetical protein
VLVCGPGDAWAAPRGAFFLLIKYAALSGPENR